MRRRSAPAWIRQYPGLSVSHSSPWSSESGRSKETECARAVPGEADVTAVAAAARKKALRLIELLIAAAF